MAMLDISSYAATEELGRVLAQLLAPDPLPCLLRGGMGAGKTALASLITVNLPGGKLAEPSSPSFTICNYYPASPPVLHCDLYRIDGGAPEEIYEFLQNREGLLLVEWAEKLVPAPPVYLDIFLNVVNDRRLAVITGHGDGACALERKLAMWPSLARFAWAKEQH